MSFLSTQVDLVRLVAVTIGMSACVPRFVSLPSNLRADAQDAYTDFGGNRTPLHVEQIRFYRVVKMQILSDNPGVLSDADACITVTSYPLMRHDSSAASKQPSRLIPDRSARRAETDFVELFVAWLLGRESLRRSGSVSGTPRR